MSRRQARRPRRGAAARLVRALLALAALAALAAAGAVGWVWWQVDRPYQGYPGDQTTVSVAPGSGAAAILEQLEQAGVLADALAARAYLVYALDSPPLVAGEYRFSGPQPARRVLARLIRGEVVTYRVTLIEGRTLEETAAALAEAGFGDREALEQAMRDPAPIADLDPEAETLEGYLFPDTYHFAHGTPPETVVATLVSNFRDRWQQRVRPRLAAGATAGVSARAGLAGVREVVTLASIVEKEAQLDAERPVIAGVYANRLSRGIALYADPTVIFALKLLGRWDGNLRRADLDLDSPYNTYRYPGLPPGPICSPGLASLLAAAEPAVVPYLYFVSRNDGSHAFAETLGEHNRNVDEWQRRYWRRRWAEQRRGQAAPDRR